MRCDCWRRVVCRCDSVRAVVLFYTKKLRGSAVMTSTAMLTAKEAGVLPMHDVGTAPPTREW
jgi:hypothetical protein